MVDDRQRKRREEIAVDGPFERPRTQILGEPLLEQQVDRRLVPFHSPLPRAQSAAMENRVKFLLEDLPHLLAVQRPKDRSPDRDG